MSSNNKWRRRGGVWQRTYIVWTVLFLISITRNHIYIKTKFTKYKLCQKTSTSCKNCCLVQEIGAVCQNKQSFPKPYFLFSKTHLLFVFNSFYCLPKLRLQVFFCFLRTFPFLYLTLLFVLVFFSKLLLPCRMVLDSRSYFVKYRLSTSF